jgi:hypothetical protein
MMAYPPDPRDSRSEYSDRDLPGYGQDGPDDAVWPSRASRAPARRQPAEGHTGRTGEWDRPSGSWSRRPSGEWSRPSGEFSRPGGASRSGEWPRTGGRTGEWAAPGGRTGEWAAPGGRTGERSAIGARTGGGPHTGGIPRQRSAPPAQGWSGRSTGERRPFVPPVKRHTGAKIFMIFVGICLVACSGVLFLGARKVGDSYPATVTLPEQLAGLARINDKDLQAGADEVVTALKSGSGIKHAVGGVFGKEGDVEHPVMVFAADGFLLRPGQVLASGMAEMNSDGFGFGEAMAVDAGPLGGVARCAMGSLQADEKTVIDLVLCGWADYGSLGLICFINSKEAAAAAEVLLAVRETVVHR